MKLFALLGAMLLALVTPAFAADVVVPWGDWLSATLSYAREIIIAGVGAVFLWLVRSLPKQIGDIITAMRLEQLLTRAVDYGIAAVDGAAKGKVLTVPVTNSVIAEAVNYAVRSAPALADRFADTLRAKILARLSAQGVVPTDATAQNTAAKLPG
jgi:hypothetical protein